MEEAFVLKDTELETLKDRIEHWKELYAGNVYGITIKEQNYIYRGLTKYEFDIASSKYPDPYDSNEFIVKTTLLYPEMSESDFDKLFAGVPEVLADEVLKISGYKLTENEFDNMLLQAENKVSRFTEQMPLVIKSIFNEMSLKEIENLQFHELVDYYVRAKWVHEVLYGRELTRESVN